jgi:hypothetical protein
MLLAIIHTLRAKSFALYERPYELNIIGIRTNSTAPNRFDDQINVFFKNNSGQWIHYPFTATTDPGTYWLHNPLHPQGTAILAHGQYRDAYQIGLHRGQYYALVQRRPVTVLRDYDRNAVLDFNNGRPNTGMFGINIHRAAVNGTTKVVDKYSAGCQVFASATDFDRFMQLCEKHKALYGNVFTYTLIDERALIRQQRKHFAVGIGGVSAAIGAALLMHHLVK